MWLGQWWLPENREDTDRTVSMTGIGKEGLGTELLDLAAQQQMNTEARKTVFCIIMGADDVVSACERLLALPFRVSVYENVVLFAICGGSRASKIETLWSFCWIAVFKKGDGIHTTPISLLNFAS